MSIQSALHRVYTERFIQPREAGTVGIDPSVRQQARADLMSSAPDFAEVISRLEAQPYIRSDPGALRTLAGAYVMSDQAGRSLELLRDAERLLNEELALNLSTQAMNHVVLGELEIAVQLAQRSISLWPSHYLGHLNLMAAYIEQGEPEMAFGVLESLQEVWPEWYRDADLRARVLRDDGQLAYLRSHPDYRDRIHQLFSACSRPA